MCVRKIVPDKLGRQDLIQEYCNKGKRWNSTPLREKEKKSRRAFKHEELVEKY
jgi:hypothetical protein